MMKETYTIRYRLLRKVMILPIFAGVVTLFAFTEKQAVKQQLFLPEMVEVSPMEIPATKHEAVQYEELNVKNDTVEQQIPTTEPNKVAYPIVSVNVPNIKKEKNVDKLNSSMVDSSITVATNRMALEIKRKAIEKQSKALVAMDEKIIAMMQAKDSMQSEIKRKAIENQSKALVAMDEKIIAMMQAKDSMQSEIKRKAIESLSKAMDSIKKTKTKAPFKGDN